MATLLPIGSIVGNGFVVLSNDRDDKGRMRVRCPACRKHTWKHQSNLPRVLSCGCARSLNQVRRHARERHRATVEQALQAFRTDYRYGEAIALEAHRIRQRRSDATSTL